MKITRYPGDCWIEFTSEDLYSGKTLKTVGGMLIPKGFYFYTNQMFWMTLMDNTRYTREPISSEERDDLIEYIVKNAEKQGIDLKPIYPKKEIKL